MCRVRRRGWRPASAVRSPERRRAVVVKAAHRIEVSGERFQVPASNCIDDALDVGINGLPGRLPLRFFAADRSGAGGHHH